MGQGDAGEYKVSALVRVLVLVLKVKIGSKYIRGRGELPRVFFRFLLKGSFMRCAFAIVSGVPWRMKFYACKKLF